MNKPSALARPTRPVMTLPDPSSATNLPPTLAALAGPVARSWRPAARLVRHPAAGEPGQPWQSQVGGLPYWPLAEAYPNTNTDQPLGFVLQLNFAEQRPLPGWPARGLLQLFINPFDCARARFYPEPLTDPAALVDAENYQLLLQHGFPARPPAVVGRPGCLALVPAQVLPSSTDWHYAHYFGPPTGPLGAALREYARPHQLREGCWLGGYGYFPQGDPRAADPALQSWELLLELSSDPAFGLQWGDCQELCVFGPATALARGDFSNLWLSLNS